VGEQVLLYGAGGHSKVIIDCLAEAGIEIEGIFDDDQDLVSLNGYSVIGSYDETECPDLKLIISIGDNKVRKKITENVKHRFATAIHPSAVVSKFARIDVGSMIIHGAIIQTGVTIGKHSIINTGASIDHDCKLGNYVHVSPKACLCASVHVGDGTHIGASATVLPGVKIGKWCVIGAGAVVNKDIPDRSVVVGVPAKIIKTLDED
jgi:sugar O-acyltransferase (sialic acid O-acetyltransferase NeuD family)